VHISKEFKVGILAIVSMAILYFGFKFLKGIDFLSRTTYYYALYDNIGGLTLSNPVVINGLTVGRVNEIEILQSRNNKILVEMMVDSDIRVSKGSKAMLMNMDFLGSKAIELILENDNSTYHSNGDTLLSGVDTGIAEFLKENAGSVADNLGATIAKINEILENFSGNSAKINDILANVQGITANMNQELPGMQSKLGKTLDNLNQNSKDLSVLMGELKPILVKANQFADSLTTMQLNTTLLKTQRTLDALSSNLEGMDAGRGTMGKLMTDDSLYIHLSNTARDLDLLLIDFQENPGRYVQFSMFGKKDKSDKEK
jgi:phospholipid/cholesterol/gamma-HCH transport system substrate-binding protein